jgi:PhnB protein
MIINPYLNFNGNAEEAFRFYHSVFGGELIIRKMHEVPDFPVSENEKDLIMHASIKISDTQFLMASDVFESDQNRFQQGNNNYISITVESRSEADRLFNGLSIGGEVEMPMDETFWGDYFGSFKDRFGVCWMISYELKK